MRITIYVLLMIFFTFSSATWVEPEYIKFQVMIELHERNDCTMNAVMWTSARGILFGDEEYDHDCSNNILEDCDPICHIKGEWDVMCMCMSYDGLHIWYDVDYYDDPGPGFFDGETDWFLPYNEPTEKTGSLFYR